MSSLKGLLQVLRKSLTGDRHLLSAYRTLSRNPLFDREFYLRENEDVRQSGLDPLAHYLLYGAAEGRDPGPEFDTRAYLARYRDVASSGLNPLFHYLAFGESEGRQPCPRRQIAPELTLDKHAAAHLRFHPDYRATNPYQDLLYGGVDKKISISPGTIDDCIALLERTDKSVIYHQHWTSVILGNSEDEAEVRRRASEFIAKLDAFIAKGGRVFWTVHNAISHEAKFPTIEAQLCADLARRAELIHVHSASVPELVAEYYELPSEKIVVAPHGNYIGVYPDSISRSEARQKLGIPDQATVFLFLGQIRRYKGIDQLIEAFSSIAPEFPDAWLVIAGSAHAMDSRAIIDMARKMPRTIVHDRHIADEELQIYFRAADSFVAPYTDVLTSGSVLLSLSFGLPVIAPALGLISELVQDCRWGKLFSNSDRRALETSMRESMFPCEPSLEDMRAAAFDHARHQDWSVAAKLFNHCASVESTYRY